MKAGKKVLGKHFVKFAVIFAATLGAAGIMLSGCSYSLSEKEESAVAAESPEYTEDEIQDQYSMAAERAEYYYQTLNLSKACSLYRLVNIDGFSEDVSNYAIKSIKADWRQSAARKAQYLRDEYSLSNTEIFYRLIDPEGENFTFDEADYAVANLLWNTNF